MSSWTTVGEIPPQELTEARLELHHAVQLVSIAVGRALVEHRKDDSHTTLTWLAEPGQWVGEEIPDSGGRRAGLGPSDLTLTLGTTSHPAERQFPLVGKTRESGLAWLREEISGLGRDASAAAFAFHYEMPPHAVAEGAPFSQGLVQGFAELGRYYANGALLLEEAAKGRDDASAILTWPHHFDTGMLLRKDGDWEVGVGFSPGDKYFPEPYLYVTAWPRPEGGDLPSLPRGFWRTEDFLGAILTGTDLLDGGADGQEGRASEFMGVAIEGALNLVMPD